MQALLVMDEADSRQLAVWLAKREIEVYATARVRQAITILEENPKVDIILTELDFPQNNGDQFLRHLQNSYRLKHIPVIAYTKTVERGRVLRAAALGVHDFLVRPSEEDVLLKKIDQVIENGMGSVLVVDDEPIIRDLLAHIVEREGFRVCTAAGGREALEVLAERKINLVITDLMMPEMNGMELLVVVKDQYPDIPVVLVTGKRAESAREDAVSAGANGYITKPFKNMEIAQKIESLIAR